MLELIINNKQVVLSKDSEVVANLSNPIFEDREENTYPFTISLSANRHIWGYIDRFTINEFPVMDAVLKCGRFDIVGNAYVSGISDDEIEIFISTDKKSFWGKLSSLYLNNLHFETLALPYNWNVFFTEAVKKNNVDYVLGEMNIAGESYNNWNTNSDEFTGKSFVLFPRLSSVLNAIMKHLEYDFESDVLDYIKNIVFINRNIITPPGNYCLSNCLPRIKVDDFLKDLENRFNLCFFVNERDKKIKLTSKYALFTNSPIHLECLDNIRKTIEEINIGTVKYTSASIEDEALGSDTYEIRIGYGTEDQEIALISTTFGQKRTYYTEEHYATHNGESVKVKASYGIPYISITSEDKDKTELRYGLWRGLTSIDIGGEAIPEEEGLDNEPLHDEERQRRINPWHKDDEIIKESGWINFRKINIPEVSPLYIYSSLLMNWKYDSKLLSTILKKINSNVEISIEIANPNLIYEPFNIFKNTTIVRGQKCGVKTQEICMSLDGVITHKMTVVPL